MGHGFTMVTSEGISGVLLNLLMHFERPTPEFLDESSFFCWFSTAWSCHFYVLVMGVEMWMESFEAKTGYSLERFSARFDSWSNGSWF